MRLVLKVIHAAINSVGSVLPTGLPSLATAGMLIMKDVGSVQAILCQQRLAETICKRRYGGGTSLDRFHSTITTEGHLIQMRQGVV